MVNIVEIIERSTQGMTKPFLCKDDNGNVFFVKGGNADRRSLIAEWLCAQLASAFGLPIAPYAIVHVPELLIDAASDPDIAVLGSGMAFGSQRVPNVLEITWAQAHKIPKKLRQDILVFDWWIRNDDRNFTELGGNPNLLWDADREEVVVIDHNAAFSQEFSAQSFVEFHIFGSEWDEISSDLVLRSEYAEKLRATYPVFAEAVESCPKEWFWVDDDVPAQFDMDFARRVLQRFDEQNFWGIAQ